MITVTINGIDRTSLIEFKSFSISNNLNNRADTCNFTIIKHAGQTYEPTIGQEVIVADGITRLFGGVVLSVDKTLETDNIIIVDIQCKDYSHLLDSRLVVNKYQNKTVEEIIIDVVAQYAPTFNTANVSCTTNVKRITFDRVNITSILNQLSKMVDYSWYVDYYKNINFFPKNDEVAPFSITDTGEKHIFNSLSISKDFSQLQNRITVRGDEEIGNTVTEAFTASDDATERLFYRTANKFASVPTVTVTHGMTTIPQTVGIDYLNDETLFDCMWNFNEKYIRFTSVATEPHHNDLVEITGEPLFPVIVQRSDSASISTYGTYENFEENRAIKSRDDALIYCQALLDAYSTPIIEATFQTYENGLRAGQIITINSTLFDVNEDLIINKVTLKTFTPTSYVYNISCSTNRDNGIVSILQDLLSKRDLEQASDETILSFEALIDDITITGTINSITTETPPYEWEADGGGVASPAGRYNLSTYA